MTEPEPEPKREMVQRQRRLCPERWAAAVVWAAMVAWQGRSRRTPGQYGPGEGFVDEPGTETRGAHQGQ